MRTPSQAVAQWMDQIKVENEQDGSEYLFEFYFTEKKTNAQKNISTNLIICFNFLIFHKI